MKTIEVKAISTTNLGKILNEYHEIYKGSDRYSYSYYIEKYLVDDQIAYCLEPSVYFHGGNYEVSSNGFANFLNENQKQLAQLYAHYGYGYKNHTSDEWYVATQLLMWELRGFMVKFSKSDFSSYMNEIKALANNHLVKPSFDQDNYEIRSSETIILNDINGVIEDYEIVDDLNLDINIINNQLIIKASKDSVSGSLKLVKKGSNTNSQMYYKQGSQTIGSFGGVENLYFELKIEVIIAKMTIAVSVIDELNGNPISNAEFEVYKNNQKIGNYTTNNNGRFNIFDEVGNSYRVVQLTSSVGYLIASPNTQTVVTNLEDENKIINLVFKNKKVDINITEAIEVYTDKAENGLNVYIYSLEKNIAIGLNPRVDFYLYYDNQIVATRSYSVKNIPKPINMVIRSNYLSVNQIKPVSIKMVYSYDDEFGEKVIYYQQQLTTDGYTSDESKYVIDASNEDSFNYENVIMTRKIKNQPMELFKEKLDLTIIQPTNKIVGWSGVKFPVLVNYTNDLMKNYYYDKAYYVMPKVLVENKYLNFIDFDENHVLVKAEFFDNNYQFQTVYYESQTQNVYLTSDDFRITREIVASNYWFVPFNIAVDNYPFSLNIEQIAIHQINVEIEAIIEVIMPPVTALPNQSSLLLGKFTPREVNPDNPFPTGSIGFGWVVELFNQIKRN